MLLSQSYMKASEYIDASKFSGFDCKDSKIEAPHIYLPATEVCNLNNCIIVGEVHYGE